MGAASALSCSPTERSTEEETPIARAVSGSLCVCVRNLSSLLIMVFVFRGATIRFVKDCEYQKERSIGARPFPYTVSYRTANIERRYTRNTVESYRTKAGVLTAQHIPPSVPPTWRESRCFLGHGLCSPTERSTREETPIAWAVSGSFVFFECL